MTQTVTPYLLYEDGEAAIAFLEEAFGASVVEKSTGEAGGLHAELALARDGGRVYLGQPPAGSFRNPGETGATALVYVLVDDVDEHHERARAAGARIIEEPHDVDYGDRRYGCADPQGHEWYFAASVRDGA